MNKLTLLPYREFSALKLGDFFSAGIEPVNLIEGAIGSANGECVGRHTHFLWKPSEKGDLAEMIVELLGNSNCPPPIAAKIMASVGVGLKSGDDLEQVISVIGGDGLKIDKAGAVTFVDCCRGDTERFQLELGIHEAEGLIQFHLTRSDKLGNAS